MGEVRVGAAPGPLLQRDHIMARFRQLPAQNIRCPSRSNSYHIYFLMQDCHESLTSKDS